MKKIKIIFTVAIVAVVSSAVFWISGGTSEFREIPGGRRIVITEGEDNYKVEKN